MSEPKTIDQLIQEMDYCHKLLITAEQDVWGAEQRRVRAEQAYGRAVGDVRRAFPETDDE